MLSLTLPPPVDAGRCGGRLRARFPALALLILLFMAHAAEASRGMGENLLTLENGARVIGFSSEYGGWDAASMVPSLARLEEPGVDIQDFVWCTADNAPFPHWVLLELKAKQWLTTFTFNNALKEELAYPGISARQIEVWVSAEAPDRLSRIATFQLERNKTGQTVRIEPVEARWIKFVVTRNWGHPTWTEMNASAAYDDGSRPARLDSELNARGKVDLYGIHFDFDSDRLREESARTLRELARYLAERPGQTLRIEGHTDNKGSDRHNLDLSQRRAEAVARALVALGVQAERLKSRGMGATQPVADNTSDPGRARNRRVTVYLTGAASPVSPQPRSGTHSGRKQ